MKKLLLLILIVSFGGQAFEVEDIKINAANLPIGKHIRFEWLSMPTMVLKPSKEQIKSIQRNTNKVTVENLKNSFRSFAKTSGNRKATILYQPTVTAHKNDTLVHSYPIIVLVGINPMRGCALSADYEGNVLIDPCSQTLFSLDGRPITNNGELASVIFIPEYSIEGNQLTIKAPKVDNVIDFSPNILASDLPTKSKLFDAISWDKLDVVKTLIEKDKSLLSSTTSVGCNLVHLASSKSKELLSYLIDKGVSTTKVCNNRYTPIMLSMMVGKHENASFLLNHGAKINAYCENEQCAKSLLDYLEYEQGYSPEYSAELIEKINIGRLTQ
ncbi:ankyrin repeat domain-containing protein [Litorilituus sediminis]|uniref:Ankyrin repeat domain-containing protein n=1 Tax=Litorilituus sediminis TaxID=718192 RepID=A0A4P6P879_9GAMM|nr:ankyrin repeat domain-containing protein [Litorilituus sediminis]QBG36479.1 ankyrin repeat domain-containing protein [Litorilituus sediminis]